MSIMDLHSIITIITPTLSYIVTGLLGTLAGYLVMRRRKRLDRDETIRKLALMTCRAVIYQPQIYDVNERVDAYLLYRSLGGNHRTKSELSKQIGEDVDVYIERHKLDSKKRGA